MYNGWMDGQCSAGKFILFLLIIILPIVGLDSQRRGSLTTTQELDSGDTQRHDHVSCSMSVPKVRVGKHN